MSIRLKLMRLLSMRMPKLERLPKLPHLIVSFFASAIFVGGAAQAGEERACARQYSLEEHLILEWAALGGDPHAQFAITQCAFPSGAEKLSQAEKIYALQWLTLARCDAASEDHMRARNRRTQRLKEYGNLSFRRFHGDENEKKLSTRDKMFRDYRLKKMTELDERHDAVSKLVGDADRKKAQQALIDQFAGMGALGLLRLSDLSVCPYFEAPPAFAAASAAAAQEIWETAPLSAVTGNSEKRGWSLAKLARDRNADLSAEQKQRAAFLKARLLQSRPEKLSALHRRAALGDLQNLTTAQPFASEGETPRRRLVMAVQYALDALGLLDMGAPSQEGVTSATEATLAQEAFNPTDPESWTAIEAGPENLYTEQMIKAVKNLQISWRAEPTGWLNHEQARMVICMAATEKSDPVSIFHVARMYANGWGFARDYNKARYAIDRAEKAMAAWLETSQSAVSWKQQHYPRFIAEISAEKTLIDAAWNALPADEKNPANAQSLCR